MRSIADDVLRLLDHADRASGRGAGRGRSSSVSCSDTLPQISQKRTLSRTSSRISASRRHVEVLGLHDVERDALRRLRADAGKAAEFVDQLLDDAFVHVLPALPEAGAAGRLDLFDERRAEHLAHDGLAVALDAAVGGGRAGAARRGRWRGRLGDELGDRAWIERGLDVVWRRVGVVGQRRRWRRMPPTGASASAVAVCAPTAADVAACPSGSGSVGS